MLSVVVCGLLFDSKKIYKMQARVVHQDHIARGFPQAGLYHTILPYVALGSLRAFIYRRSVQIFIDCGAVLDIYMGVST